MPLLKSIVHILSSLQRTCWKPSHGQKQGRYRVEEQLKAATGRPTHGSHYCAPHSDATLSLSTIHQQQSLSRRSKDTTIMLGLLDDDLFEPRPLGPSYTNLAVSHSEADNTDAEHTAYVNHTRQAPTDDDRQGIWDLLIASGHSTQLMTLPDSILEPYFSKLRTLDTEATKELASCVLQSQRDSIATLDWLFRNGTSLDSLCSDALSTFGNAAIMASFMLDLLNHHFELESAGTHPSQAGNQASYNDSLETLDGSTLAGTSSDTSASTSLSSIFSATYSPSCRTSSISSSHSSITTSQPSLFLSTISRLCLSPSPMSTYTPTTNSSYDNLPQHALHPTTPKESPAKIRAHLTQRHLQTQIRMFEGDKALIAQLIADRPNYKAELGRRKHLRSRVRGFYVLRKYKLQARLHASLTRDLGDDSINRGGRDVWDMLPGWVRRIGFRIVEAGMNKEWIDDLMRAHNRSEKPVCVRELMFTPID